MPLQSGLARVGLTKQTAKGSAATNPTFSFGVTDGSVNSVDVSQDREERTLSTSLVSPAINRTQVVAGQDYTTRAFPGSVGLLLYAALGSLSTSGAGVPYTHTITPGTALPYLSLFGDLNGIFTKIADAGLDELEISWDGTDPLEVKPSFMGCTLSWPGTYGTVTTDEEKAAYFRPTGGTFKMDAASATAVTAKIKGGSVKIGNSLEPVILSNSTVPADVFPGDKNLDVSLSLIPDDVNEWRKVITGASGGTTVSEVPIYGSFEVFFSLDANNDLKLAATNVGFMGDYPDADSGGGPVELQLDGAIILPASGAAFTATLHNATASY